ncbi:hypothetical protein IR419_001817 [Campylobacter coli]|nr:hypothetical protein [Campylobacter coli]
MSNLLENYDKLDKELKEKIFTVILFIFAHVCIYKYQKKDFECFINSLIIELGIDIGESEYEKENDANSYTPTEELLELLSPEQSKEEYKIAEDKREDIIAMYKENENLKEKLSEYEKKFGKL